MKNTKLVATKSLTYATRRLRPEEEFLATGPHARVLIAIGKAKPATDAEKKPPAKAGDEISKLRMRYSEVFGKRAFPGWNAVELKRRIDEADES